MIRRRSSRPDSPGRLMSITATSGSRVEIGGEARRAVLRLDDLDVRIGLQKRPASRDDDRMIVDDENPQEPEPSIGDPAGRTQRPAFRPSIDTGAGKINGEAGKA